MAAIVAVVTPAGAQPELDEPAGPSARLTVTQLEAVLGPGTVSGDVEAPEDLQLRALIENRGEAPLSNLELITVVHRPVTTRSDLRHALDRGQPEGFVTSSTVQIRDGGLLQPGEIAGAEVTIPGSAAGWAEEDAIYPVRIAVRRGFEVLDEVTTAVVHLATSPNDDLSTRQPEASGVVATVVVWPLATAPWRGPDGTYDRGVDAEIRLGGRLDRLLAALEEEAGAPVLLAPPAHLLEDLRDRADGFTERTADGPREVPADAPEAMLAAEFLARLQAVIERAPFPPVSGPYADADVAELAGGSAPLPSFAAEAATEGRQRLRQLTGRDPDGATYLGGGWLNAEALDLLPAEHLLLPWSAVQGPDLAANPDLPFPLRRLITPSGRRLSTVVADPYVTDDVASPMTAHGHPIAVQRVLAATAMIHLGQPSRIQPLLVFPPADWQPDPQVPAPLIRALRNATWLALTAPTEQLASASRPSGGATLADDGVGLGQGLEEALARAGRELEALVTSLPDEVTGIGDRNPDELEDQLLRAASVWFARSDQGRATLLVADVQQALDQRYGEVTVPASAQVTLTSERGALPVTLQRSEGGPITVRVTVSSRGNLRWPERTQEVALTGAGTQTVSFDTVALGRGTFTVTVRVTDATGTRLLDEADLSVRSTAISRPALLAIAGVVVILLIWGAVRRRRPKRPKLEVVPPPEREHSTTGEK
ncbi:MAG: DUF6049 family protein [Nitriliruptorales bacterium]|nr:DUF6049 family protein [Nitriliruptorales bacterium]